MLDLDRPTVTGKTLGQNIKNAKIKNKTVIRQVNDPFSKTGGLSVLFGNLAPKGAIVKTAAVNSKLLKFSGPAKIYESQDEALTGILNKEIKPGCVVVIRYEGPKGGPGMPEAGLIPIPKKLAKQGVKDMVRISDGRMSGTASGTIIPVSNTHLTLPTKA